MSGHTAISHVRGECRGQGRPLLQLLMPLLAPCGSVALNTTRRSAADPTPGLEIERTCVCDAPVPATLVMNCVPPGLRPTAAVSVDELPGLDMVSMELTEPSPEPWKFSGETRTREAWAVPAARSRVDAATTAIM